MEKIGRVESVPHRAGCQTGLVVQRGFLTGAVGYADNELCDLRCAGCRRGRGAVRIPTCLVALVDYETGGSS